MEARVCREKTGELNCKGSKREVIQLNLTKSLNNLKETRNVIKVTL